MPKKFPIGSLTQNELDVLIIYLRKGLESDIYASPAHNTAERLANRMKGHRGALQKQNRIANLQKAE